VDVTTCEGERPAPTLPEKSVPLLPKDLFRDLPARVAIVDTGNDYPSFRDGTIAEIEGGLTESDWVAKHLGPSHPPT
jgi:hypothetical protein